MTMTCACTISKTGDVASACGAHHAWLRTMTAADQAHARKGELVKSKPFTEFERDPDVGVGVMWEQFITAVGIWVYTNENARRPTIAEAALAFNTTVDLIREAVDDHPWLYSPPDADPAKQEIWSDGE